MTISVMFFLLEMMWICAKTANGFKGSQELPETKVIVQASLSTATQVIR